MTWLNKGGCTIDYTDSQLAELDHYLHFTLDFNKNKNDHDNKAVKRSLSLNANAPIFIRVMLLKAWHCRGALSEFVSGWSDYYFTTEMHSSQLHTPAWVCAQTDFLSHINGFTVSGVFVLLLYLHSWQTNERPTFRLDKHISCIFVCMCLRPLCSALRHHERYSPKTPNFWTQLLPWVCMLSLQCFWVNLHNAELYVTLPPIMQRFT